MVQQPENGLADDDFDAQRGHGNAEHRHAEHGVGDVDA